MLASPPVRSRENVDPRLLRVWNDVQRGAEHFQPGENPLPVNRLSQFAHGLALPFHLARVLLADGYTRRRYLRVATTQAAVILAGAVLLVSGGYGLKDRVEARESAQEQAEKFTEAQAELEEKVAEAKEELRAAAENLKAANEEADAEEVRAAAKEFSDATRKMKDAVRLRATVKTSEEKPEPEPSLLPSWLSRGWLYVVAFFSALHVSQWAVIALSRDYHTELARELSVLVGAKPEDEPLLPRIRFNMQWMRNKTLRRIRAALVFGVAVPLFWLAKPFPLGKYMFPTLTFLWGAWWFLVFTAGKTARAWAEQSPREPWFLRGWNWLAARMPLLRWGPFRAYGSVWTTFTRPVFAPAACAERQPWPLSGLAVVRALAALPLVKCYLRPLIPVAASLLVTPPPAASALAPEAVPAADALPAAPPRLAVDASRPR